MIVLVRKSKVIISAIVLKGLHFNLILEVSWLKTIHKEVNIKDFTIKVGGKSLSLKIWPGNVSNFLDESIKVFCLKPYILLLGKTK